MKSLWLPRQKIQMSPEHFILSLTEILTLNTVEWVLEMSSKRPDIFVTQSFNITDTWKIYKVCFISDFTDITARIDLEFGADPLIYNPQASFYLRQFQMARVNVLPQYVSVLLTIIRLSTGAVTTGLTTSPVTSGLVTSSIVTSGPLTSGEITMGDFTTGVVMTTGQTGTNLLSCY